MQAYVLLKGAEKKKTPIFLPLVCNMHHSAIYPSSSPSCTSFCSCDNDCHQQEMCFLLCEIAQLVT